MLNFLINLSPIKISINNSVICNLSYLAHPQNLALDDAKEHTSTQSKHKIGIARYKMNNHTIIILEVLGPVGARLLVKGWLFALRAS